jgi:phosphate-selective porin OprO/OprP
MKYFRLLVVIAVMGGALAGIGRPARADEAGTPPSTTDERLNALEQEIRVLKRQRELEKEDTTAKAKETPIITAGKEGFALKSADGNFRLRLRGQLQADGRFYFDDNNAFSDTFLVRRARPIIEGTVFQDFNFRLMPDFAAGTTTLFDAYAEWKHWPWLSIRGGKFKPPVGLEQLQYDPDRPFVETGFSTALVPNRDVGFQIGGDVLDGVFNYAVGVFNGVPDGSATIDLDAGDAKDLAARIFVKPFKKTDIDPLQGFGIGIAGTYGAQQVAGTTTNLPTYKTAGQNTFFSYRSTTFPDGDRLRLVPQFNYYWGSFGLFGEYVLSEQKVNNATRSDRLRNKAWQVAASYVLTGDDASYNGVNPKHPFNLKTGDWGAFEVVGRYGVLDVDNDAFAGSAASFANPATSASKATAWGVPQLVSKQERAHRSRLRADVFRRWR